MVQPNGRVVVPYEGLSGASGIRSFSSDDGGATWNASVQISTRTSHAVPGVRTSPLPSAEINRDGVVYVVWQDRRFEPGGTANDIIMSTSADGTTWSAVTRIPLDPVGSNIDHFIPGLAVDRTSAGSHTLLALTYYTEQPSGCMRQHLQHPGQLLLLTRQRADLEHPAEAQRPHATGLDRTNHPGRHGR